MMMIAPAVARAAAESGVALRPVTDFEAYRERLKSFVFASGTTMKPIFQAAKLLDTTYTSQALSIRGVQTDGS